MFPLVFTLTNRHKHVGLVTIKIKTKPIVTWLMHLAPVACFPALGTGYMFFRAWHRLHVFPRLAPVTCFSALGTGYMFFRAWHRLHVFPRLSPVTCFPALVTGCMFSRASNIQPGLGTGCMFSRAWHRLNVFALRTFARKSSNIDNFIKLLLLIANELLVSEMQK